MTITCKACGIVNGFIEEKGTQVGLYCNKCGKWIKWLNKDETRLFKHYDTHDKEIYNKAIDDFREWLKTQIVGLDNKTKEILVVVNDKWELAVDRFKYECNDDNAEEFIANAIKHLSPNSNEITIVLNNEAENKLVKVICSEDKI